MFLVATVVDAVPGEATRALFNTLAIMNSDCLTLNTLVYSDANSEVNYNPSEDSSPATEYTRV